VKSAPRSVPERSEAELCYWPLLGERSESLRGEALQAMPVEGALSPNNRSGFPRAVVPAELSRLRCYMPR